MTVPWGWRVFVCTQLLIVFLGGAIVAVMSLQICEIRSISEENRAFRENESERDKMFEAIRKRQIRQEADLLVKQQENLRLADKLKKRLAE